MNEKGNHTTPLEKLFRENASNLSGWTAASPETPPVDTPTRQQATLLRMPSAEPAPEEERNQYYRVLRTFFRTGKGGGIPNLFPALLHPFRQLEFLPTDYPFWMDATDEGGLGLPELLQKAVATAIPDEKEGQILKDNLPRLERIIRRKVGFADIAYEAKAVFQEALDELTAELNIQGEEATGFQKDLQAMNQALPHSGVLIPFLPMTPFRLLGQWSSQAPAEELQACRTECQRLINRLRDLLAIEKAKDPEAHNESRLHDSFSFADNFLKFDELATVLPSGQENVMPAERRQRVEQLLATLESASSNLGKQTARFLTDANLAGRLADDWQADFAGVDLQVLDTDQPVQALLEQFDREMEDAAQLFAAMRLARLELNDNYRSELHADFFAHFDWRSFSDEERAACPPVVLLIEEKNLRQNLQDFSQLLSTGRPARVIALRQADAHSPDPDVFRQELSALTIAHRNVFVWQGTLVNPQAFLSGLAAGMSQSNPAFWHLQVPSDPAANTDQLFIQTSAAVEGRSFPGLVYDPEQGPRWGRRFRLDHNPQSDSDWPLHTLHFQSSSGEKDTLEVAFTFADAMALRPDFQPWLLAVPTEYWDETLLPLSDFMQLSPEDQLPRIPFIWVVDEEGLLFKAAVALPLVLACSDRLDYWHYLQENAGIHSYHVEEATQQLQAELEDRFQQEMEALKQQHEQELAQLKRTAATEALEQLANNLLDLDLNAPASPQPIEVMPADPPEEAPEEKPEEVEEVATEAEHEEEKEEELALSLGEPYIDTPLCTSCNACLQINGKVFKYNSEKQAYIADPNGGPFADIVRAAEQCPVRIIHPGAPQNPDEPDLEALIKRAEPFNQ